MVQISAKRFAEKLEKNELSNDFIMDVRELHEWEMYHLSGSYHIPLQTLPERLHEIDDSGNVYLLCAHGVRSFHAMQYLHQQGFRNVINVEGGIAEVSLYLEKR